MVRFELRTYRFGINTAKYFVQCWILLIDSCHISILNMILSFAKNTTYNIDFQYRHKCNIIYLVAEVMRFCRGINDRRNKTTTEQFFVCCSAKSCQSITFLHTLFWFQMLRTRPAISREGQADCINPLNKGLTPQQ